MRLVRTREVLLKRSGLVFLDDLAEGPELDARYEQAAALELAQLAYVPSARLARRLRRLALPALTELVTWLRATLAAHVGGGVPHEPLFRSFPDGIPEDTAGLWVRKVLVHFFQGVDQPCLFCDERGTTHALDPCLHVVCDRCFDGTSYRACPVCERAVAETPFLQPAPERVATPERVAFRRLDVGASLDASARELVAGFCARTQAMSPDDVAALTAVVEELGARVLPWLPETIAVRENVAHVLGALFRTVDPAAVLPVAGRYLKTATDVLRLVAVLSGADPALQPVRRKLTVEASADRRRWAGRAAQRVAALDGTPRTSVELRVRSERFRVAPLRRPLRRALLALLDAMPPDTLAEDMLRHRSAWEWLGEHLHPGEHAKRYPTAARAFAIVRGQEPAASEFRTFGSRLAAAMAARDVDAMLALLEQRPGELARRYDHALRIAGDDALAAGKVMAAFTRHAARYATPVLITLRGLLAARARGGTQRVFWPKGATTSGYSAPETRPPLRADVAGGAIRAIEDELLRRFGARPRFEHAILDDALRGIVAPFNERTAARAAVALPRGSRVALEPGKTVRLFLHWCEPERRGETTDIDLSVGFYDGAWKYLGACSWSQLRFPTDGSIAISAGDLRAAPFPDGASELVDVDREAARLAGIRYCVMVVNNYRGMAFSALERGFAGLMMRDDTRGLHFDPRTVQLRFDLAGEHGIYVPLVVDLESDTMHWLDVYSKGELAMNTVERSNRAITTIAPNLLAYFGSGVRPSMYELGALHAAARCPRVVVRGAGGLVAYTRRPDEPAAAFLRRLLDRTDGAPVRELPGGPVLAALHRGDLELAEGSTCYALYRETTVPTVAASDFIR